MSRDGDFARSFDHGKPWRNPSHKPIRHIRPDFPRHCLVEGCRVISRNEGELLRHMARSRLGEHCVSISLAGWRRDRDWKMSKSHG